MCQFLIKFNVKWLRFRHLSVFLCYIFSFYKRKLRKKLVVSKYFIIFAIKIIKADNMDLTHNIIEYVNCCVGAFANRFKLSSADSYAYLRRFKGIDFLLDCYAAEHTLSIEDAVEDITMLCKKNGGRIGC